MTKIRRQAGTAQHGSIRAFAAEVSRLACSGPVGLRQAKELVAQRARLMRQQGQASTSLDLALQNSLQKQSQIYQMLARILRTVRDSERTLLDNIR